MRLSRLWLRTALGASALGLVVPVALVLSVGVVSVGGGLGGVGALGQLVAGPAVPSGTGTGLARRALVDDQPDFPAPERTGDPAPGNGPVVTPGDTGDDRARTPRRRTTPERRRTREPDAPARRRPPTRRPPPSSAPSEPPSTPPPTTPPERGPVRRVGDAVKENVTNNLPGSLDETGGQVIDTLVETAETVLPPGQSTDAAAGVRHIVSPGL
jgi:hypothetical protein